METALILPLSSTNSYFFLFFCYQKTYRERRQKCSGNKLGARFLDLYLILDRTLRGE